MMAAGNPNWWGMHPQFTSLSSSSSSSSSSQFVSYGCLNPENPSSDEHHHHHHQSNQDFPVRSWSQLLMGSGLGSSGGEEERFGGSGPSGIFEHHEKKLENWEDEVMNNINININNDIMKQEGAGVSQLSTTSNVQCLIYHEFNNMRPAPASTNSWNTNISSPTSCVTTTTTTNNNLLSFSKATSAAGQGTEGKISNHHNYQDHSSECNSNNKKNKSNKKARVEHESSAQPALKVRKEKLGDRITALHQLVSPFGKTDTASVLSEAIGYIRFLESQIQALSSPYMRNTTTTGTTGTVPHQQQQHSDSHEARVLKDLRSRGLCLVPLSCTQLVGNDNGADYWAPAALGGGF